eukprot:IDg8652t1
MPNFIYTIKTASSSNTVCSRETVNHHRSNLCAKVTYSDDIPAGSPFNGQSIHAGEHLPHNISFPLCSYHIGASSSASRDTLAQPQQSRPPTDAHNRVREKASASTHGGYACIFRIRLADTARGNGWGLVELRRQLCGRRQYTLFGKPQPACVAVVPHCMEAESAVVVRPPLRVIASKGWRLKEWLVPVGADVHYNQRVAVLRSAETGAVEHALAPHAGKLVRVFLPAGASVPPPPPQDERGPPLAEIKYCPHSVVFSGLCALCGADVSGGHFAEIGPAESRRLPVAYDAKTLTITREEAESAASVT